MRAPETFFALEKLRLKAVGNMVGAIQRGWRSYLSRRKCVALHITKGVFNLSHRQTMQLV